MRREYIPRDVGDEELTNAEVNLTKEQRQRLGVNLSGATVRALKFSGTVAAILAGLGVSEGADWSRVAETLGREGIRAADRAGDRRSEEKIEIMRQSGRIAERKIDAMESIAREGMRNSTQQRRDELKAQVEMANTAAGAGGRANVEIKRGESGRVENMSAKTGNPEVTSNKVAITEDVGGVRKLTIGNDEYLIVAQPDGTNKTYKIEK